MQKQNVEKLEDDLNEEGFELPKSYKIIINIFAIALSVFILCIYFYLIFYNPDYLKPEDFGLSTLLIFSLALLLLINLPWKKLGLRITKIGMIELEQTVKGQSKNMNKDIADLQIKIDEIDTKLNDSKVVEETSLSDLLIKFLTEYNSSAFSPLRIKNFGAKKSNYTKLNNYSLEQIKLELRRLLGKNKVSTRISQKGNTLYTIKK